MGGDANVIGKGHLRPDQNLAEPQLKMTVKQALKLVGLGLLIGLPSAFILRVMSSLLFGVSTTDPITFVSISLVLTCVAMLASYIPALRATKVDPMVALRAQ
jgi:putative ABC transport system permease protein